MSLAKIHVVDHARQIYAKVAKTDEEGKQVAVPVTSKRTGTQKLGRGGRPMTRRIRVSNKEQPLPMPSCGKCGVQIKVGDSYRWFSIGFRSHSKHVRCMKSSCTPKPSERESSAISEIYAAQESAHDQLQAIDTSTLETAYEVQGIVGQVADAISEVAQTYRDADENFGGGGNTPNGERADTLDSAYDELSGWQTSGDEESPACDEHDEHTEGCADCAQAREDWATALIDEATDAIDNVELP